MASDGGERIVGDSSGYDYSGDNSSGDIQEI